MKEKEFILNKKDHKDIEKENNDKNNNHKQKTNPNQKPNDIIKKSTSKEPIKQKNEKKIPQNTSKIVNKKVVSKAILSDSENSLFDPETDSNEDEHGKKNISLLFFNYLFIF